MLPITSTDSLNTEKILISIKKTQEDDLLNRTENYLKKNYKELFALDTDYANELKQKQFKLIENNHLLFELIDNGLKFSGKTSKINCRKNTLKFSFPVDMIT